MGMGTGTGMEMGMGTQPLLSLAPGTEEISTVNYFCCPLPCVYPQMPSREAAAAGRILLPGISREQRPRKQTPSGQCLPEAAPGPKPVPFAFLLGSALPGTELFCSLPGLQPSVPTAAVLSA